MTVRQAISLESLAEAVHSAGPQAVLSPVVTAVAGLPVLPLTAEQAQRLSQGQAVLVSTVKDSVVCAVAGGRPIAVAEVRNGAARPMRVFNL